MDHVHVRVEGGEFRRLLGPLLGVNFDLFVHVRRRRRRRLVLYTDGRGGLDIVGGEHYRTGECPRGLNFRSFSGICSAEEKYAGERENG